MNICWETKSPALYHALIEGFAHDMFLTGGNIYNFYACKMLSKMFDLSVPLSSVKFEDLSLFRYAVKNTLLRKGNFDLIISDPYSFVFDFFPDCPLHIVVLHHFDYNLKNKDVFHQLYFSLLKHRLKKVSAVVTVSRYWKEYLIDRGVSDEGIHIIYNSFDPEKYRFDEKTKADFKKKYHLSNKKPLIYIGNASPVKGACEVYNQLKDSNYQLVMSGKENKVPHIDALFLQLPDKDFRIMLGVCDLVVSLSQLPEGWNRVAHEALLAGTPVIGSGIGGMHELLTGAKQLICDHPEKLQSFVKEVLGNKERYSDAGFKFVRQFDLIYFSDAWVNLVENICSAKKCI